MNRLTTLAILLGLALTAAPAAAQKIEAGFITNARQVTLEGRRAGEGYFSADGTKMIFQSEREPGNPFYQIYVMDLEMGDVTRVSPGHGKTTCAWIHPDGKQVLFASTHLDPKSVDLQKAEFEKRATGRQGRYAWDYDEYFEIFVGGIDGKNLKNVTNARGYDAEGSFSPDGKLIAFSSNRHAYTEKLSEHDRKVFDVDKSYLLDLYIMNADGSNLRRLTTAPGYDGSPFFSPDGKRIVWRRFNDKDKTNAEVYTIKLDGTDERQITRMGAMSWCPYYHPSGDYIIYATNFHGFNNFELYIVDPTGRGKPVRVTDTEGFDGLPVFFPDGKRIAWASTRNGNKKGQLFFADWNDAAARKALGLDASGGVKKTDPGPAVMPNAVLTDAAIRAVDVKLHVGYLASAELAGRATGSPGERLAGDYIASMFKHFGLQPEGDSGTYFQSFSFTAGVKAGPKNTLSGPGLDGLTTDRDWRPMAFSKTGSFKSAPVVFAGYGIKAPPVGKHPAYDSYEGLDVKDKWVMVLRYAPQEIAADWREHLLRHSSLRFKGMVLREAGARGMIVVSGPRAKVKSELVPLRFDASSGGTSLAAVSVTNALADKLLAPSGKNLEALQAALDGGGKPEGFAVAQRTVAATIDLVKEKRTGRNVVARLTAGDTPIFSAVVLGAHYDHLGHGEGGNSLASGDDEGGIHYGADDNASGVAGVLEAAQWLAALKKSGRLRLQRDIVFAAWSGEELGLLGSSHYVASLAGMDPASVNPPVTACLNMDMIGRLREHLMVQGVGSSSIWRQEIERRNAAIGLPLKLSDDCFLPTDSTPFYLKKVPILTVFTGAHSDYHTPRDTVDKVNVEGAVKVTRLIALLARSLGMREKAPDHIVVERKKGPARTRAQVSLGTMPDYAASDVKGLKLQGVRKGSPADKAGLQGGDIIVELAGKKIENIYEYMYAMNGLVAGKKASIVVERGGKRVTLTIVPEPKE